jgi:pimeloyl-ACP methyl ester carboxylesterase
VTTVVGAADPQVGLLRIDGLEVATLTVGSGPALLLLNGLTRPYESWAPLVASLPDRRIVTFDVPGIGRSPTPAVPLSIPALARVATKVLDAAGLECADVLGYSYGGLVAQQVAIAVPHRVRNLVLVATSCGVGGTPGPYVRSSFAPAELTRGWPAPDALAMMWQLFAVSTWSSIPFLGAITQPTLIVQGDRDRLVPPENASMLARRIPGARVATVSGGHDLQRADRAPLLARVVDEFLREAFTAEPLTAPAPHQPKPGATTAAPVRQNNRKRATP